MATRRSGLAVTAIGLLAALLMQVRAFELVDRALADAFLRTTRGFAPGLAADLPDVALVTIDARSLRSLGDPWPWPAARHAEIVRRLHDAGARAIAFDLDLSELGGDAAPLVAALRESRRVVLASYPLEGADDDRRPLPALAEASAAVGAADVDVDGDGLVRRTLATRERGGRRRPSFAAAALAVAMGETPMGGSPAPLLIDYRRDTPPIPRISSIDVLEGRFDPRDVAGRMVVVGPTVDSLRRLLATPLGGERPSVWIQSLAMRTLAAQRGGETTLRAASPGLAALGVVLLSLALGALRTPARLHKQILLLAFAAGCPLLSFLLVSLAGLQWHPFVPMLVIATHFVLGLPGIREHIGGRMEERDLAFAGLLDSGTSTAGTDGSDTLRLALSHLGEATESNGVALFRSEPNGELLDTPLEWRRSGRRGVGDPHTATLVLSDRQTRVFQGGLPGTDRAGGQALYSPLFVGPVPVGVLVVERDGAAPLAEPELRTIATLAGQLALSVRNARLYRDLQDTFEASIAALASAIESRDGFTHAHCSRIARIAALMADRLGLPLEEVEAIRLGGLLHDVGKLGTRDEVLLKADRLTPDERRHVEMHPDLGHRVLAGVPGLSKTTLGCVRHHHERWNGTGYPDGLAGEEIPLGARIVSVIDVWDALSHPRPYKAAFPQAHVREILRKDGGSRFEPALLDLFLEILDEVGADVPKEDEPS